MTGGAGHIGFACAAALAERGAIVAIVDVDEQRSADAAARIASVSRAQAIGIAADLRADEAARTIVDQVLDRFGGIDILVNNAAFTGASNLKGWAVPFEQQTLDAWNAALAVNLGAPFSLAQHAAKPLATHGRGSIINVASIYGLRGPRPDLYGGTTMQNPAAYGASKGGLIQLTRYLATTLAPNVRVNCIAPGGVARGQPDSFQERYVANTPLRRMATEADFQGAFLYFASDASAYVTGQTLAIDGGWTAW